MLSLQVSHARKAAESKGTIRLVAGKKDSFIDLNLKRASKGKSFMSKGRSCAKHIVVTFSKRDQVNCQGISPCDCSSLSFPLKDSSVFIR